MTTSQALIYDLRQVQEYITKEMYSVALGHLEDAKEAKMELENTTIMFLCR